MNTCVKVQVLQFTSVNMIFFFFAINETHWLVILQKWKRSSMQRNNGE